MTPRDRVISKNKVIIVYRIEISIIFVAGFGII